MHHPQSALTMLEDGLMRPVEVARFLGVSSTTVWRLLDGGKLPSTKIGGARRIPRRAVVELAAMNLRGPGCGMTPALAPVFPIGTV